MVGWGGRDFALFDGSVDDVRSIGSASLFARLDGRQEIDRRSPSGGRQRIGHGSSPPRSTNPRTYLASTDDLITIVEALDLESVRVSYDDLW